MLMACKAWGLVQTARRKMTMSFFDRMIAAREKQARRYVNGALLNLDDETLNRAGLDRKTIAAQGAANYPF